MHKYVSKGGSHVDYLPNAILLNLLRSTKRKRMSNIIRPSITGFKICLRLGVD